MEMKIADSFVYAEGRIQTLIRFDKERIFNYDEGGLLRSRISYQGFEVLDEVWR
jgi:hypothetical protein